MGIGGMREEVYHLLQGISHLKNGNGRYDMILHLHGSGRYRKLLNFELQKACRIRIFGAD
jgi:hypothetical protein